MKYKLDANVELDEYEIIQKVVDRDEINDLIDVVQQQIDQWQECSIIITVRHLVCMVE